MQSRPVTWICSTFVIFPTAQRKEAAASQMSVYGKRTDTDVQLLAVPKTTNEWFHRMRYSEWSTYIHYQRAHANSHDMYLILSYLFDTLHPVRVVQYDVVVFPQYPIHQVRFVFWFQSRRNCSITMVLYWLLKRRREEKKSSQDMFQSSMTIENNN